MLHLPAFHHQVNLTHIKPCDTGHESHNFDPQEVLLSAIAQIHQMKRQKRDKIPEEGRIPVEMRDAHEVVNIAMVMLAVRSYGRDKFQDDFEAEHALEQDWQLIHQPLIHVRMRVHRSDEGISVRAHEAQDGDNDLPHD